MKILQEKNSKVNPHFIGLLEQIQKMVEENERSTRVLIGLNALTHLAQYLTDEKETILERLKVINKK